MKKKLSVTQKCNPDIFSDETSRKIFLKEEIFYLLLKHCQFSLKSKYLQLILEN